MKFKELPWKYICVKRPFFIQTHCFHCYSNPKLNQNFHEIITKLECYKFCESFIKTLIKILSFENNEKEDSLAQVCLWRGCICN